MEIWGFKINQYYWCIMNKDIEGDHCKILCQVYDIKTYHKDPKFGTTIIDMISSIYIRQYPLKVACGKVHKYIVMTIDLSDKGKVKFTVYGYISNMLEDLPEYIKTG